MASPGNSLHHRQLGGEASSGSFFGSANWTFLRVWLSILTSWGTVGCGSRDWKLSNTVREMVEFVKIPFVSNRTNLRWLEVAGGVSKALTHRSRHSITSSFKSCSTLAVKSSVNMLWSKSFAAMGYLSLNLVANSRRVADRRNGLLVRPNGKRVNL